MLIQKLCFRLACCFSVFAQCFIIVAMPSEVFAADNSKFDFYFGFYRPNAETDIRYDEITAGDGTTINIEDDLNVDDDKVLPALQVNYHVTKQLTLEFGYFDFSRSGSQRIETTIDFGDEVFEIDTDVNTEFDAEVYRLSARYAFYSTEKFQLSGLVGVHATDFDLSLDAPEIDGLSERLNEIVPVPLVGAFADYRINDLFTLSARVEYMDLEVDDIQGGILNTVIAVDYSYSQSLGIRLAYTSFQIDGETDDFTRSFAGLVDYRYRGPEILLRYSF